MADIKKFLDQSGVSTLWGVIAAELEKKAVADNVYTKTEVDDKIAAATYDDSAVKTSIQKNADDIAVLNGESTVEGSVAYQIAQIVAGADTSYDTLKEIADWIATHGSDAATMNTNISNNTKAIADLAALVGDTAVATQIANAIDGANLSQYALASDLTALAGRVSSVEGDITSHATRLEAVETKATNNATDISAIKTKIEDITSTGGEPNVIESISVNGTKQTVTDYNVDITVPVIEALTEDEIKAACTTTA